MASTACLCIIMIVAAAIVGVFFGIIPASALGGIGAAGAASGFLGFLYIMYKILALLF